MRTWRNASGQKYLAGKKCIPLFLLLTLLLTSFFILSCILGAANVHLQDIYSAFEKGDFDSPAYLILLHIRLPRALASILSGSALAVAGIMIQAVLNNPMAAPNIIGVNAGAGFAAALTIGAFPGAIGLLPFTSYLVALAACMLIYAISQKSGANRLAIILIGIAVGSVLSAGTNTLKVLFPDSVYDADVFMMGGFSGITYGKLTPACYIILLGILISRLLAREIDVLCLGEDTAASLGMNVGAVQLMLLMLASALAGAAVSFAGLLGFVGLLVPHIMRRFVGNRHTLLIPSSAMLGAVLVLGCDILSRVLFAPYELPVGIMLSFIGGIFFICLAFWGKRGIRG